MFPHYQKCQKYCHLKKWTHQSTYQIIIVIYRIFIWPHLWFFNRINIITTNVIFRNDQIIIDIYRICTWPYLWFFNRSNIITTNVIFRNNPFPYFMFLINFFNGCNFSLCWFISLFIEYPCIISILIMYFYLIFLN